MKIFSNAVMLLLMFATFACAGQQSRARYLPAETDLKLTKVILYRNGIGYFEREGIVEGDSLVIKVRKDQVNDLLKSLTVIEKSDGEALSVAVPLDTNAWQNAAISSMSSDSGQLADVLNGLKGTYLTVQTKDGRSYAGRIAMVEAVSSFTERGNYDDEEEVDDSKFTYRLTLLDGGEVNLVNLNNIETFEIADRDLVMQLQRTLDASEGDGIFQQVDITIRLSGDKPHDLVVSYVVEAPVWKPTYRLVMDNNKEALLQSWAIVDNTSGENWDDVSLSLTAGAPIAFKYDLHTPKNILRPDLTDNGLERQAAVAYGETTYNDDEAVAEEMAMEKAMPRDMNSEEDSYDSIQDMKEEAYPSKKMKSSVLRSAPAPVLAPAMGGAMAAPKPSISISSLQKSSGANTSSARVAGLTRYDLNKKVTLPDGSASMVAVINEMIEGERLFLFNPEGSGVGFEHNPYMVVRFKNTTPFALEPGPVSIYVEGSFVGEGLSASVATDSTATIPFAVEPSIFVTSSNNYNNSDVKITKIVNGILYTERFNRLETTWKVSGMKSENGYKVLVRHPMQSNYTLVTPKKEKVEQLDNAYLIPVEVKPGKKEAELKVVEQSPSSSSISIFDSSAEKLLIALLEIKNPDKKNLAKLKVIIDLRKKIGKIDSEMSGLKQQQYEYDNRTEETRQNLYAIKKDAMAADLRKKLNDRMEEFSNKANELGRKIVELSNQRLQYKIELEDQLQNFTYTP
ncbi:MAG: DUF4139 domain-containing protein [Deltaproteobacteria bacterium]|nr:DUF4139 domain-containing protein [Deltaproteobacteria bacterium]